MNIYNLIDRKVIDYAEVLVFLFEHCNLRCVFCPQDHSNPTGASREEIMSKVPGIVGWINANQRATSINIHIMGGELFQDHWVERNFLDIYQEFIDTIKAGVRQGLTINPVFATNLVFSRSTAEKVISFMERNNLKLAVSYDAHGRFNAGELNTFKSNVEMCERHINMMSIVATRQNISAVIKGDPYFDYLYSKFAIDWETCEPARPSTTKVDLNAILMPKESEILALYKHLIDNYPKCLNVTFFTEPAATGSNKMKCTRGNNYTVQPDNYVLQGCAGTIAIDRHSTKEQLGPAIVEKFLDTRRCFECVYFERCPFTCFTVDAYKKVERDVGTCIIKLAFQHAEANTTDRL